jgi:5-(carboxyamino)imidazole ribonucleotide synthase
MSQISSSDFKLGIMSGGQLGKMLTQAASVFDVQTYVMDPSLEAPSASICHQFFQGDQTNFDDVYNFGKKVNLLTFVIEHINIEALRKLKQEGVTVYPDPETLNTIKDKGLQKEFYKKHNIPTSAFQIYKSKEEVLKALDSGEITYPFVQKLRTDGYDGKGVAVVLNASKLDRLMDAPCIVEDAVNIEKELAVIVARSPSGEIKCFPLVEMEFNEEANLVEQLICPADISKELEAKSIEIAIEVAKAFDLVGLLAVELFLDKSGEVSVNEAAPRTHNSGHHTIEANVTSQYEQQLRAIFDWPLGDTTILSPAVMLNLLGEAGFTGTVKYEGLEEVMKVPGVKPHIYGKKLTKPFRKMGHVTILGETIEIAKEKAEIVKNTLKVKA